MPALQVVDLVVGLFDLLLCFIHRGFCIVQRDAQLLGRGAVLAILGLCLFQPVGHQLYLLCLQLVLLLQILGFRCQRIHAVALVAKPGLRGLQVALEHAEPARDIVHTLLVLFISLKLYARAHGSGRLARHKHTSFPWM